MGNVTSAKESERHAQIRDCMQFLGNFTGEVPRRLRSEDSTPSESPFPKGAVWCYEENNEWIPFKVATCLYTLANKKGDIPSTILNNDYQKIGDFCWVNYLQKRYPEQGNKAMEMHPTGHFFIKSETSRKAKGEIILMYNKAHTIDYRVPGAADGTYYNVPLPECPEPKQKRVVGKTKKSPKPKPSALYDLTGCAGGYAFQLDDPNLKTTYKKRFLDFTSYERVRKFVEESQKEVDVIVQWPGWGKKQLCTLSRVDVNGSTGYTLHTKKGNGKNKCITRNGAKVVFINKKST